MEEAGTKRNERTRPSALSPTQHVIRCTSKGQPKNVTFTSRSLEERSFLPQVESTYKLIMKLPWKRLIRFEAADGRILRGEPILATEDFDLGFVKESDRLEAKVITGDDILDTSGKTQVSGEVVQVKKLLGPLAQGDVPILRCVGLNYAKHSQYCTPKG